MFFGSGSAGKEHNYRNHGILKLTLGLENPKRSILKIFSAHFYNTETRHHEPRWQFGKL